MAAIDMSALENAIGDGLINIGAELNEIAPGVAALYGPGAGLATGAAGDALTLMGSALTGQSSGLSDEQIGMALGAFTGNVFLP
jgi:hypothetical protein